jgi:hypothetical protein
LPPGALDRDRVVEVARVLAVDRHRADRPEVGAGRAGPSPYDAAETLASSTASAECVSGMPNLRMMIWVSTPGSSILPSTSTIRAGAAAAVAGGQRVISTTTMSSRSASRHWPVGTWMIGQDTPIERRPQYPSPLLSTSNRRPPEPGALEHANDASFDAFLGAAFMRDGDTDRQASPRPCWAPARRYAAGDSSPARERQNQNRPGLVVSDQ